jgi:hypothetical protein
MVEQQPSKLNTRVRFPSPAPILSMPCRCRQFSFRRTRLRLCRQEFPSYKYQDYRAHHAARLLHSPTAQAWLTRHSCPFPVNVKRRNPPRPGSTLVRIFRHEKISDVISNARSDDDRHRGFQQTQLCPRWRRQHHELAGLSAAASGIQAAIVTARSATVLRPSAQGATSASALTELARPCGRMGPSMDRR